MRLRRLRLEAFGPYRDPETIDFRALRYSHLFLIHGPVGSGKTFILDGICFALYGRSSGGERELTGLRSLSAPEQQDTVATLDFQSGAQGYRVERRLVPVEGSNGEFAQEVALFRLPEIGEPSRRDILSSTLNGVASMLVRLLGLTADQFCQVAILPQGRFRKFLLSQPEHRREILSNMFGAERHARFQKLLVQAYEEARQHLEKAWKEREQLVGRYQDAGGDPREFLSRSTEELKALEHDCGAHQERSLEWERSLEEAVRYEILDRQRDTSERELAALNNDGGSPEDQLAARLREALPQYEEWRRLTEEAEVISAELYEQRAQYERLKSDTNFLEAEVERARQLEEERFSLRRSLERLDQLETDSRGVTVLSEELEAAQDKLAQLQELRASLGGDLKESKARITELEEELSKLDQASVKLVSLRSELKAISDAQEEAKKSSVLEDAHEQARQRLDRLLLLLDELQEEKTRIKRALEQQRERDMVDALRSLRKELKKDQPCPLCGSEKHPKPFSGRKPRLLGGYDDESLEQIRRRIELTRKEVAQARERVTRLEGRLEERDELTTAAPQMDEETVRKLRQTVAAVEQRVGAREGLKKELRELKLSTKPARARLKKMRLLKERLSTTIESIESQLRARNQTVLQKAAEILPGPGGVEVSQVWELVEEERQRLEERLDELDQVTYSTERAELMAETFALQLAESRASEKQRESLLAGAEELKNVLVDRFRLEFSSWDDLCFALGRMARESSVKAGQEGLLDRETLIRTVERQLHQSQELLSGLPAPEMKAEQIRHALAREREQLEVKVGRRVALEKSLERSREDVGDYDRLVEEIREAETRKQRLEFLSGLASGCKGVAFHEWYLGEVFSKVVDAANLRLEVLAPNRFTLGLADNLEVRIFDVLAGKERSATTLSGGESFLASLALALGLGDVLQSEREARERLQTLFIDEGFGYLDRRALEASLDCLESLKQEGRTVGVISHVNALRERIRAQVVVAPNDSPLPYGVERVQVFSE